MSTEDINALSPMEIFSLDALSGQTTPADCLSLGVKTRAGFHAVEAAVYRLFQSSTTLESHANVRIHGPRPLELCNCLLALSFLHMSATASKARSPDLTESLSASSQRGRTLHVKHENRD